MYLDLLLDRSARRVDLTRDGLTELDRVTNLTRESYPSRAHRRRISLLGAIVAAVVLLGGVGTVAAVAAPHLFHSSPPLRAVHIDSRLDRSFTVDGIVRSCRLSVIVDLPAGPDAAALRQATLDYLGSPGALLVEPDSPILDLLLQAKDGSLGPITATTYADAWGYALMAGLEDHLKPPASTSTGSPPSRVPCASDR